MRSLPIQSVLLAASTAGGQILMVFVLSSVGRQVGPASLGVVAVAMGAATVLAGLVDFGANSYWLRELSAHRLPAYDFRRRSGTKLIVGLSLAFAIALGLRMVGHTALSGGGFVFGGLVLSQTLQVAIRAESKNLRLAAIVLMDRVALVLGYLSLTHWGHVAPDTGFYFAYLAGSVIDGGLCWRAARPELRPTFTSPLWLSTWRGSRYYGASVLLTTLQSLDVVIAAAVGGQSVAGGYGAVSKWTQPIGLATNSYTSLLAPVVARAESSAHVWGTIRRTLWLPSASILVALIMAVMAKPLVLLLMGEQFIGSIPVLRVLCAAASMSAASQLLLTVLQARGREKTVAASMALGVGTQLVLVGPLAYWFGALGVAYASLAVQFLLLIIFVTTVREAVFSRLRLGRKLTRSGKSSQQETRGRSDARGLGRSDLSEGDRGRAKKGES